MSFHKILIANRAEIACRVIRTARQLGYRTVAVFSDADATAPHVTLADEAVRIGAPPASDSYLKIDALIAAARQTRADAVHPGYGFLSENAAFAQACADADLVFIGPPPAAIAAMGDKARAKARMREAGVPTAPGYLGEEQSDERLIDEAKRLGTPLLVKAVAGGGGRGMRLVRDAAELPQALASARREAQSAFGDGTLMLERLIEGGRHIEIQVFADSHGNAIHLGERDCTAQRRRQKVIEEAPSPIVSALMRERMGCDAAAAALAVGYVGAGTVEFIVDQDSNHYFLEMNTRLQVEHPVTECITGLDLVAWQLRVAAGEPLPLRQDDVRFHGHAIEARLYAEDPYDGFKPQTGRIAYWRPELALRDGVRIDSGIAEGGDVTPYYDPMVAKLIAHGRDRDDAIRKLRAALEDSPLLGLPNNARFLRDLLGCDEFRDAKMTTTRLDEWQASAAPLYRRAVPSDETWCLAAALRALQHGTGWRPASVAAFDMRLRCGDEERSIRVRYVGGQSHCVQAEVSKPRSDQEGPSIPQGERAASERAADKRSVVERGAVRVLRLHALTHGSAHVELDGVHHHLVAATSGATLHLVHDDATFTFVEPSDFPDTDPAHDPRRAVAPVAGLVTQVLVAPGDTVAEGQPLACVEAMKMEMWLHARAAGRVVAVHAGAREQVAAGALLVELNTSTAVSAPTSSPPSRPSPSRGKEETAR
jgi:geranyl-CoA carboxylase alpha subunit